MEIDDRAFRGPEGPQVLRGAADVRDVVDAEADLRTQEETGTGQEQPGIERSEAAVGAACADLVGALTHEAERQSRSDKPVRPIRNRMLVPSHAVPLEPRCSREARAGQDGRAVGV